MSGEPVLLVGTVGEGPWRSDDGGATWRRIDRGMFLECDVRALAIDPRQPSRVFAGTNEGLHRSDDGGNRWHHVDSPMDSLAIWSLAIHPNRPDVMLAGTRPARLYRSLDGGRSWHRLAAEIQEPCERLVYNRVTTIRFDPDDPDVVWVGVEIDGVWQSRDCGESWSKVGEGLSSPDVHDLAIIPTVAGSRRWLATTNNDLNVSDDGGRTWQPQRIAERLPHRYCRGLLAHIDDSGVVFLGNGNGPPGDTGSAWRSRDGAVSWERLPLPGTVNSTIWAFANHPAAPLRVYAYSCSGQIFVSRDGGDRWEKLSREFGEIRSLAVTVSE